ncbi:MAG: HDIG domain-containing protein [Deltaproteobacteria bacterium]|nr:HDIG domain-containing protein [Deltaproteobacteria bacterium]
MNREEAMNLIRQYVKNENMIRHCLASEAVLRALAKELGEDENAWAMAGLLHDIDVEITNADLAVHTKEAVNILRDAGVSEEIIEAVRLHNEEAHPGEHRRTRFQHALAAGETITGMITATALVYPDKRLSSVKVKSITKRMKEKAFAKSVNRDIIMECEKIGLDLDRFAEIALKAMQEIAADLGL